MDRRTGVVDVRPLPHGEKHAQVFQKFDTLAPGEAFVLVSDHEPLGLLRELQSRRPRGFEWNVLERGPEAFRIEIERRASETPRNVTEFLGRDHDGLDAIFAEARRLADGGACAEARATFQEFAHGLIRHIAAEENALFPAFENATGMQSGPTMVMRVEHRQIGGLLEDATAAIAANDAGRFAKKAAELQVVLAGHNEKEEGILYATMDLCLAGERERDEFVHVLQAQSALSGCGCCSSGHGKPAAPGRRLEIR